MTIKITENDREKIRLWYVKGMLSSGEIAERLNVSRQSVVIALRKMGISTQKSKIILQCDMCKEHVEKPRSHVRSREKHFCSHECYNKYIRGAEYQKEAQRQRVAREKCRMFVDPVEYYQIGVYTSKDGESFIFKSREDMLEWKRTGLPMEAISAKTGKTVTVAHRG